MKELPARAQLYLASIWLAACCILVACFPLTQQLGVNWIWLLVWVVGFCCADYFEVAVQGIGMTLSEAMFIFLVGALSYDAIYVIAIGSLLIELIRRRVWYKALFNIGHRTITIAAMVLVFTTLHTPNAVAYSSARDIAVFLLVAITHYLLNTIFVGLIIAFASNQPIRTIYHETYERVQWIHLLTLPIGALMAAHWSTNRWLLVFDVLVLLIAQRSFVAVAQLQIESQKRKKLADEREQLLIELKSQQDELIRASKLAALGTFSAGIAHEFNNLLTVVLGQGQLGLLSPDPQEMRHSLDSIIKVSRRGRSITQGLLTFARQGETQRLMAQLGEIVSDTVAMVEHDFEKVNIHILCEIDEVPPTYCDPGQILQVILNLLSNARDATSELGGGLITIRLVQEDTSLILSVTDTGIGMTESIQSQVFQPFVTTKGNNGTGLGLAICYGIIEGHNGSIQISSALGKGTTVSIHLPIIERDDPPIRMSPEDFARINESQPHPIDSFENTTLY